MTNIISYTSSVNQSGCASHVHWTRVVKSRVNSKYENNIISKAYVISLAQLCWHQIATYLNRLSMYQELSALVFVINVYLHYKCYTHRIINQAHTVETPLKYIHCVKSIFSSIQMRTALRLACNLQPDLFSFSNWNEHSVIDKISIATILIHVYMIINNHLCETTCD